MENGEENEESLVKNSHRNANNERLQNLSRAGLNAATGGTWEKARNAPIVGAAAKKAEEKVADKLGNTKLGKKIAGSPNQQKNNLGVIPTDSNANANNQSSNDVGSHKIQKAISNKAKNIWNQRKKNNKENDSDISNDSDEQKDTNDSSNDNESEDDSDNKNGLFGDTKARIKRKIIIKVILFAAPFFILFTLFVIIASVLTQNLVVSAPTAASKSFGTDEFETITGEESKLHEKEVIYYERLKEVEEAYGGEININYLNAILLSLYYQSEYDISDEDLSDSAGIDYGNMTEYVDIFAAVILSANSTDYSIDGPVYNVLKNSEEFKDYYIEILKNKDIDDVLFEVFDLAKELESSEVIDETVITSDTTVTVEESSGGKDKPKTKTLTINEYISGSIYSNTDNLSNSELVKAYTIVYSTNIVAENKKLSINANNAKADNVVCSVKEGCSYDKDGNLVTGPGERNSRNSYFYKGNYYYKIPLSSDEQALLKKDINSVFGSVLVKSDGTYPTLDWSKLGGLGDGDYKTLLKKAYGNDLTIKSVGEDSYILDGSYGDKQVKTTVIFYDQKDYPNSTFCGLKGYTIGGSGCGVTAMAIVASTYENNEKYDPIYMNNEARKKGMCSSTGTAQAFFNKEANSMHYKYIGGTKYNKSLLNSVLKHLVQGHLVVARMGYGHFTGGGHYIVLGGVDPDTKKVYVYDPNNRSNKSYRNTGNGWYSFNDIIVKEAYNFYIIWKG